MPPTYDEMLKEIIAAVRARGLKKTRVDLQMADDDAVCAEAHIIVPYSELPLSHTEGAELATAIALKINEIGEIRIRTVFKTEKRLIHAELGDYVLIHDDYHRAQEDFHVGIVTSIFGVGNKRRYGVRHLVCRHRIEMPSLRGILELTRDDYGGHPKGFLRVLSEQEAIRQVRRQVRRFVASVQKFLGEESCNVHRSLRAVHAGATMKKFTVRTCDPMKEAE